MHQKKLIFVVHKHAATHLHYDFRLELNGVLKSWAVPKGPSTNPSDKRLAVQTPDHELSYASFEGTIPEGYGAGEVEIWDSGTWTPEGDAEKDLSEGKLSFTLEGKRLKGKWSLIRTGGSGEKSQWLLFRRKEKLSEELTLTNPEREVSPGLKKSELADYFTKIGPEMLKYVAGRPITVVRSTESGPFLQRKMTPGLPKGVLPFKQDGMEYLQIKDQSGLDGLAQMGAVEIHTWNCKTESPDRTDSIVIDIDPGAGVEWKTIADTALLVKDELERRGLKSFLKLTGGEGLHVVAPIQATPWDQVSSFSKSVCLSVMEKSPGLFTLDQSVQSRVGKILLDYRRNFKGASSIAPFSPRLSSGIAVCLPVSWTELSDVKPQPTIEKALSSMRIDPWKDYSKLARKQKLASVTNK